MATIVLGQSKSWRGGPPSGRSALCFVTRTRVSRVGGVACRQSLVAGEHGGATVRPLHGGRGGGAATPINRGCVLLLHPASLGFSASRALNPRCAPGAAGVIQSPSGGTGGERKREPRGGGPKQLVTVWNFLLLYAFCIFRQIYSFLPLPPVSSRRTAGCVWYTGAREGVPIFSAFTAFMALRFGQDNGLATKRSSQNSQTRDNELLMDADLHGGS